MSEIIVFNSGIIIKFRKIYRQDICTECVINGSSYTYIYIYIECGQLILIRGNMRNSDNRPNYWTKHENINVGVRYILSKVSINMFVHVVRAGNIETIIT